jgi:hypothetical protein
LSIRSSKNFKTDRLAEDGVVIKNEGHAFTIAHFLCLPPEIESVGVKAHDFANVRDAVVGADNNVLFVPFQVNDDST